jgi:hypothetical protein
MVVYVVCCLLYLCCFYILSMCWGICSVYVPHLFRIFPYFVRIFSVCVLFVYVFDVCSRILVVVFLCVPYFSAFLTILCFPLRRGGYGLQCMCIIYVHVRINTSHILVTYW